MAVEIVILSGSRQGETLPVDLKEFCAGGSRECAVCFDTGQDPGSAGLLLRFRLDDDGWKVQSVGSGSPLINDLPIAGSMRVRSGDIVRLSTSGPDFVFNVRAVASKLATPAPADLLPRPIPVPLPLSAGAVASQQPTASAAASQPLAEPARRPFPLPRAEFVGIALAAFLLGLAWLSWLLAHKQPDRQTTERPPTARSTVSRETAAGARMIASPDADIPTADEAPDAPAAEPSVDVAKSAAASSPPAAAATAQADPWESAAATLSGSLFLVVVEQPKPYAAWPFAMATAVGDQTLLTTGSVVEELAVFRQKGWRVLVQNASRGLKLPVKSMRIHVGYEKSAGTPDRQIYFDLGLLKVDRKLPGIIRLAGRDELNRLEPGLPVAALGIGHEAEALNRFQTLEPELTKGKVFIVTSLPPAPGPRLLHVGGSVPEKAYGSPIIDSQGRLLAIYAETAAPQAGASDWKLYYAPVVEPDVIREGKGAGNSSLWIEPAAGKSPPPAGQRARSKASK